MSRTKTAKLEQPRPAAHEDRWRLIMITLCVVGILVAGYLSWAEITGGETVCLDTGAIDCTAVQTSAYSKTLGIPVALLGLAGYLAILAVLVLEDQVQVAATYGRTLAVSFALFGVIFSVYLSVVEGAVLEKWCQWCIASAIIISILLVMGSYRLYTFLQPLRR